MSLTFLVGLFGLAIFGFLTVTTVRSLSRMAQIEPRTTATAQPAVIELPKSASHPGSSHPEPSVAQTG